MNCSKKDCRCERADAEYLPYDSIPERQGRPHDMPRMAKILNIEQDNAFVRTFTLDLTIGGEPGQFVLLWLPRIDEKPFSIGMDDGKTLQLTIAKVGTFTEKLFELSVGDSLGVRGPYGTTFSYKPGECLALVGGGYGAVPLYFLATRAIAQKCTVEFVLGARSKDHLLYLDRIRSLPHTKLHVATDDGSEGFKGFNVGLLRELLFGGSIASNARERGRLRTALPGGGGDASPYQIDRIMTVGPERMMKAVSDFALECDIPCQVSVERYMKCGFGICGQCALDDKGTPTCIEGPVMDHLKARAHVEFGQYHRDKLGRKHPF